METRLTEELAAGVKGPLARSIVERCVHCGFCNATCPTYQLLGDELDGPRGRIYLIKQVLEGSAPTARTQLHLDRCLTCRACETTCPSGVEYGRLLDIGRELVDEQVARPPRSRLLRALLRHGLTSRASRPLLRLLLRLRPALPAALRRRIPPRSSAGPWPQRPQRRQMLLLAGCVQPALAPNIDAATARVFDAVGVQLRVVAGSGCCGAIHQHLGGAEAALRQARRNIDAWWPAIEAGAEAVVMNASGCGVMVKDYGELLHGDPAYAQRAARIAALTRDVSELLPELVLPWAGALAPLAGPKPRVAFHPPCTLQHGQRIRGVVEPLLGALGADVRPFRDTQACCGSAGTYSLLHSELADALRRAKLDALGAAGAECVLSANVGCITHLAAAAAVPVRHWIEWVDSRLAAAGVYDRLNAGALAYTGIPHERPEFDDRLR